MESWRRIFENTPSMRFMLTDVSVDVCGSVAWVTLYENLTSSLEGQNISVTILATNVFLKASGAWRMIHHHGSSVAPLGAQSDPSTVH
jgi:ketosteroid isomerase-like protein